ncbi:SLC13 family permease [Bacillus infantis]|uniref:SLC13 family permease n=1 Tax=Bacillus infantis TaxID=324767 RepID=UPI0021559F4E|nr:DASS family sodium-coupled anion symporter [Bacillus infantis]MCR6611487.1 DASS family sodium-coupled anion symporter [Bacillus infantis]
MHIEEKNTYSTAKIIGLILGPLSFAAIMFFMDLDPEPKAVLASTAWISIWWITEALPIPATSLLPLILLPISGGLDSGKAASAYGNPIVFMYMGGFIIAIAIEKWNLHKRIALTILSVIGTSSNRIILGVMLATSLLSMWINNTATALMMFPIALALTKQIKADGVLDNRSFDSFSKSIMLSVAYSATIGGLATLVGSIPNAAFAAISAEMLGRTITFSDWLIFALPLTVILLILTYFYITRVQFPVKVSIGDNQPYIKKELQELGPVSYEEKMVAGVFFLTGLLWVFGGLLPESINDSMIGIFGALLLFFIPAKNKKERMLEWEDASKLPWGLLLLFGGGLSLAAAFTDSKLTNWIGAQLESLIGFPYFFIVLTLSAIILFLTEIMSNTAVSNMVIPITVGMAYGIGIEPYGLMAAAALASSCAFMLPISTAPNAIVFGSDYIKINDMVKSGFWLNIISLFIIVLAVYYWLPRIF